MLKSAFSPQTAPRELIVLTNPLAGFCGKEVGKEMGAEGDGRPCRPTVLVCGGREKYER